MWGGGLEIRACNHGDQLLSRKVLLLERCSQYSAHLGVYRDSMGMCLDWAQTLTCLCVQVFRQRGFLGREDGVTDALRERSLPPAEPFPGGWNVRAGRDHHSCCPTPPWGLLNLSKQGSEGGGPCGLQNVARSPPPLSLSFPFGLVMVCE